MHHGNLVVLFSLLKGLADETGYIAIGLVRTESKSKRGPVNLVLSAGKVLRADILRDRQYDPIWKKN